MKTAKEILKEIKFKAIECINVEIVSDKELSRLRKIEAAARKFTAGINTSYEDEHRGDCSAYHAMPMITDDDCTCGLVDLVKLS